MWYFICLFLNNYKIAFLILDFWRSVAETLHIYVWTAASLSQMLALRKLLLCVLNFKVLYPLLFKNFYGNQSFSLLWAGPLYTGCCLLHVSELALQNNSKVTSRGFFSLTALHGLERLDFYRTSVTKEPLMAILKASPQLKHLNLGENCHRGYLLAVMISSLKTAKLGCFLNLTRIFVWYVSSCIWQHSWLFLCFYPRIMHAHIIYGWSCVNSEQA